MKRFLFFLTALLLTSIGYAQPMNNQYVKKAKNGSAITVAQTPVAKHAITGAFKTNGPKVKKAHLKTNGSSFAIEKGFSLKPMGKVAPSLFENFLNSPEGRSLKKLSKKSSNGMMRAFRFGETVMDVPYSTDFSSEDDFMIINNNEDESTWSFSSYGGVYYYYDYDNDADDYIIVPPLRMEAGKSYDVTVNADTGGGYPERFEVVAGKEATVTGLSTQVIAPTEYDSQTSKDFTGTFTPAEDGVYYIAIHCISDAYMYYLWLNSFSVEVGASTDAPAAPTITATPSEDGALSATVEVKAPKNAINGEKLTDNLTKIEIYRDGEMVYEKEDVAPNSTITFVDENLEEGSHKYYAIAYNASGPGQKSEEVSVFIGPDYPADVENFMASDKITSVLLSWDKVGNIGANGGYVDPSEVDYDLYGTHQAYSSYYGYYTALDEEPFATIHDGNTHEFSYVTNEGEEQEYVTWAIIAKNESGESTPMGASLIVGKPYDLPITEGFANNSLHYFWDYNATLLVSTYDTDGDGTGLVITSEEAGYASFYTGKLNLKDAVNPYLVMDLTGYNVSQFYVVGFVDGGEMQVLGLADVPEDFGTYKIPLSSFVGENYSQVGIVFEVQTPTEFDYNGNISSVGDYMLVDNIRIYDMLSDDLAIKVESPATVKAGSTATITSTVENLGDNAASSFTVSIKAGDKVLLNETVDEELPSTATMQFTAEFETSIFDEAADIPIVAEVTYNADKDTENNKAETQISIKESISPAPENLVAQDKGGTGVDLSWEAPKATTEVTEDFEDTSVFPTFDIGGITDEEHYGTFGDWTLYDATGANVYTWNSSSISYENQNYPCAWQVFDPVQAGFAAESYPTTSGSQFLMSMCTTTGTTDHWLISPELLGTKQTISFMARVLTATYGAETFQVLASSTDNKPESFVLVQDYETDATEWTEFLTDLPDGTKYFAIRHTSTDIFALFLDDITYLGTKLGPAPTPTAYNIYFEGELIGTVAGDVTTYTVDIDKISTGEHTFGVTAVYENGKESKPAKATVEVTGNGFKLGDVNHDGEVSVTDVMLTVTYVLDHTTDHFFITEANMNGDNDITIADVTAIIDIVLKTSPTDAPANAIGTTDKVEATISEGGIDISLSNASRYTGLELSIDLPRGAALTSATINETAGHKVETYDLGNGHYRLVACSFTGAQLLESDAFIHLNIEGTGTVKLSDILLTNSLESFSPMEATAITNINVEDSNQPAYSINGTRVNGATRGIVIQNGQKRVVK